LTLRIICVGAHPDDCELEFGGTAAKWAALGRQVKFLAVTNGAAGHYALSGEPLAEIRRNEASEAARRLGIAETEILANPDGELLPTLAARQEILRQVRAWRADIVITHRPWDYHPDHRYTSQLVQDSAYLVLVPSVCPETPPLDRNPLFLYLEDRFQTPVPFAPDVAVDIDDVWDQKIDALDAYASQFYEWLPWVDGELESVPADPDARREWLSVERGRELSVCARAALARRYGPAHAREVRHAETFQVCEYGRRPSPGELDLLFPD
jgi:LmbE family N-acetylglucosaminyl deacetylase